MEQIQLRRVSYEQVGFEAQGLKPRAWNQGKVTAADIQLGPAVLGSVGITLQSHVVTYAVTFHKVS